MNRLERDALEFSAHLKSGGWRLGLLAARNVEKGRGGAGRKGVFQPKNSQKISAAEFAKMGGPQRTTAQRVLRHLEAWEKAAAAGLVPLAADLGPNSEPELDMEKLPPWTNYYSTESARPSDPWRSPKTRRTAIDTLSHQEKADLVGQAVDSDPTVLHTVARQSPTARQQMRHSVVPPAGLGGTPEFPKPVEGVRLRFVRDVRDYAAALRFMADEFDGLTEQQVSQLLDAHEALEVRVKANIIRLRQRLGLATEDDVIEGHEATPVSELEWQQD